MIIRTWAMHFNITTKVRPCPNLNFRVCTCNINTTISAHFVQYPKIDQITITIFFVFKEMEKFQYKNSYFDEIGF